MSIVVLTSTRFLGPSRAQRRKLGMGRQGLAQAVDVVSKVRVSCPRWGSCRGPHSWLIKRRVKLRRTRIAKGSFHP